jgi:hypothetical protein
MLEILKTLKDTPLPIVLVIGGLIFLLIPFIQKINAKEVGVETTNQSLAGFIGFMLLVIGIGLYIVPSGTATSTLPTAIPQPMTSATETQMVVPVQPSAIPTLFSLPLPTNTIIPPTSFVPDPKCPSVIQRQLIEQWAQIGDVSTKEEAKKYIDNFDRQRIGGEFLVNAVLPAGVAIVTDFGNGESNTYLTLPVRAIVHYHSYGVFEVISDYTAIQTGACMTIIP